MGAVKAENKHTAGVPLSPLDGRYSQKVAILSQAFSEFELQRMRVRVEIEWWKQVVTLLTNSELSPGQHALLQSVWEDFDSTAYKAIQTHERRVKHDVKAVEYYLRDVWQAQRLPHQELIHFGVTSEDVTSCAYGLVLTSTNQVLCSEYRQFIASLETCMQDWKDVAFLARTHGQRAIPSTFGKEIAVFLERLLPVYEALHSYKFTAKFFGAVGTGAAWKVARPDIDWLTSTRSFVTRLGLVASPVSTQIVPSETYTQYFQHSVTWNGILLDLARDFWLYISYGFFSQQPKKGQVGSSTMPHKVNPILFENAEGNSGISTALLQHFIETLPVSRMQRDLSDSTVKRNFGLALGHSVLATQNAAAGLQALSPAHDQLQRELEDHYEVLAEAVQTVLRSEGNQEAYELLQQATQGTGTLDRGSYKKLIQTLPLSAKNAKKLMGLHPRDYLGYSADIISQTQERVAAILTER